MSGKMLINDTDELKGVRQRFAEVLSVYLQEHKLTMKEMCPKWGFNESQMSQIIIGRKNVTIKMIITGRKMGLDTDYVLFGTRSTPPKRHPKVLKK